MASWRNGMGARMRAMMSALAHARRPAVMTAVALVLVAVNCLVALASPRTNTADLCVGAAGASNPIAAENTCLGTRDWLADHPFGPDDAIEGYSNPVSAQAGDTVHLYVSTT